MNAKKVLVRVLAIVLCALMVLSGFIGFVGIGQANSTVDNSSNDTVINLDSILVNGNLNDTTGDTNTGNILIDKNSPSTQFNPGTSGH